MFVKFCEPYAVHMAAKGVDVIEHVPDWFPKIGGISLAVSALADVVMKMI